MSRLQLLNYGPLQRVGGDAGRVGGGLCLGVRFRRRRSAAHVGVGFGVGTDGGGESMRGTEAGKVDEALHEWMGTEGWSG